MTIELENYEHGVLTAVTSGIERSSPSEYAYLEDFVGYLRCDVDAMPKWTEKRFFGPVKLEMRTEKRSML